MTEPVAYVEQKIHTALDTLNALPKFKAGDIVTYSYISTTDESGAETITARVLTGTRTFGQIAVEVTDGTTRYRTGLVVHLHATGLRRA